MGETDHKPVWDTFSGMSVTKETQTVEGGNERGRAASVGQEGPSGQGASEQGPREAEGIVGAGGASVALPQGSSSLPPPPALSPLPCRLCGHLPCAQLALGWATGWAKVTLEQLARPQRKRRPRPPGGCRSSLRSRQASRAPALSPVSRQQWREPRAPGGGFGPRRGRHPAQWGSGLAPGSSSERERRGPGGH